MLTRLFDFWKVKLWLELDGHVEVTNPNESIDTVYPADKTSFVPRCPKLYSLIVGDMVTLAQGAQPIFSPHISVTIALSVLSLIMATMTWAPRAPVFTCRLFERQRGTESRVSGGWWQQQGPVTTAASHPALVTSQYLQNSPLFSFFSEMFKFY